MPAYGGNRRVSGLPREEVAMLAGVSVDYYIRMERGHARGVSDSPARPTNTARFMFLDPAAPEFYYEWDRMAGDVSLAYESLELVADPGLVLNGYSAEPGTASQDALNLLASWAATADREEQAHTPNEG
jgi:hypothetical protein